MIALQQSEVEALRQQVAALSVPGASVDNAQEARLEASQAISERDALEQAFRTQMEQAQRSLSAKTIEVETLRRQLLEAPTPGSPTRPAAGPDSFDISTPPKGEKTSLQSESEEVKRLTVQNKQLHQRMTAIEEEKAVMLHNLREHVMMLARENFDLKQGREAAKPEVVNSVAKVSSDAAMPSPAQEDMNMPAEQTSANADKQSPSEGDEGSGGGGSWLLSTLLSPFLTDGDKREIHAESYVDQNGLQPAPGRITTAPT